LREISTRGVWPDWIEYFLMGVARRSEDARGRAGTINAELAEWQKNVAGESTKTRIRERASFQVSAGIWDAAQNLTRQRVADRLVKIGTA